MANTRYENFIIENKLEELLMTKLDMNQFLTVDTTLQSEAGMVKNVHVYKSTGSGEDVTEGNGNSGSIEMSYDNVPYTVGTYQARFVYTDEDAMTDPFLVDSGIAELAKDIANDYTTKALAEFDKADEVEVADFDFDAFADALAELKLEDAEEAGYFALVSPTVKATLRKNLKDTLQYVEAHAHTGYIGTVCGVPVYTSKAIEEEAIYIANKEAVTAYMKKGIEVEQQRDANTRVNTIYARNVKVVALTDKKKAVKVVTA